MSGGTIDVPVIDESVVTWVGGGGCECDGLTFVNIGGDIDVGNCGGDVGDGDLDGFGGAGSVVVGDCDGDVVGTCFGEEVAGVGDSGDGGGTIVEVPGDGVGVVDARVAVSYAEVEGFALVEVGSWGGEVDNRGEVIDFDCGGLLGATAIFIGDGEDDIVVTVIGVGMGDISSGDRVCAVAEVPGVGEIIARVAICGEGRYTLHGHNLSISDRRDDSLVKSRKKWSLRDEQSKLYGICHSRQKKMNES